MREAEQGVEHQDVAGPDQEGVHRADRQQDAEAPPESRHRRIAAAAELQAEADAEQQREDRVELAFDEDVLEKRDGPIEQAVGSAAARSGEIRNRPKNTSTLASRIPPTATPRSTSSAAMRSRTGTGVGVASVSAKFVMRGAAS